MRKSCVAPLGLVLFCCLSMGPVWGRVYRADVIVYGATAGGTVAAVEAAEGGSRTLLVEPSQHIGGMLTGGLGRTDMDRQQHVIGGRARQFFLEAGRHYDQAVAWTFEPSVASQILEGWIGTAGVEVLLGRSVVSVETEGGRILQFHDDQGDVFQAAVFIDASYEGDLMARAGVSYTVGREGQDVYGEALAGVKEIQPGNHQLHAAVSPFDDQGRLLPYVIDESRVGPVGSGDKKVQAYCFRLCLSEHPENQVPFTRPEDYDADLYELLGRYLKASEDRFGRASNPLGISRVPGGKTDVNSGGPISTNLLSASWDYPEADYEERDRIWQEHRTWTQGLLYFLSHDPGVPEYLREEMQGWGLAKDEFVEHGNWPPQLYVREARRMVGAYVMTQHDLEDQRRKFDSIGMGGYNMDVREVEWVAKTVYRFPVPRKEVLMEGYITVNVEPYEIPYRTLLPRFDEVTNLLVTSCVSASHMAYSSIRMEPQYMIMGHAAGVAADLAVETGRILHRLDLSELQRRLQERGQILSTPTP